MAWPKNVDSSQIRTEWYSGSGGGGQHRNKHQNSCRMTHTPTGKQAQCADHKSRERNRKDAFVRLATKLLPLMRAAATIDIDVNTERVRTYNVKRGTVKDERVPGKVYSFDKIIDGDISELLDDVKDAMQDVPS